MTTGAFGVTTLPDDNNNNVELWLARDSQGKLRLPVPRLYLRYTCINFDNHHHSSRLHSFSSCMHGKKQRHDNFTMHREMGDVRHINLCKATTAMNLYLQLIMNAKKS